MSLSDENVESDDDMNDPELIQGFQFFCLLSAMGALVLFVAEHPLGTFPFQFTLFLCAFVLRFAMSILIYQFGLVDIIKDEDASGWWTGVNLYRQWVHQGVGWADLPFLLMGAFEGNHRGYYYLLAVIFFATDAPVRPVAAVLNCFFGALTVVVTFRIARALFSSWVSVRAGWWACLFPSLIMWSAQTIKEPIIILMESVIIYGAIRLKRTGFSLPHIVMCAVGIIGLMPFRFYAVYVAGAAVILGLVMPAKRVTPTFSSVVGVLALIVPMIMVSGVLVQHEAQAQRLNVQYVQHFRQNVAEGTGSGVETRFDMTSPVGFGAATVVGSAHVLLAPFPWQLLGGTVRKLATVPELVIWWWLFFAGVLPGLRHAIRTRLGGVLPLLVFLAGMGLLYSVAFGNVGLAYRHRAQLLPWLLIFGAVGLEQRMLHQIAEYRARRGGQALGSSSKVS